MSDERTRAQACDAAREMEPWLPHVVDQYLDIGCGSGIVTGVIADACRARVVHIVDGDGAIKDPKSFNGYTREPVPAWGDVRAAARRLHKEYPLRMTWAYVAPMLPAKPQGPFDLVTSFLSWGHHYPLGTYLDAVAERQTRGGRLIMDWRRGHRVDHEAWREMMARRHYKELRVIRERPKYVRLAWSKER